MAPRSELHTILVDILGSDNVYFQQPPDMKMSYPCIIYKRDTAQTRFGDNKPYTYTKKYLVTVISRNPDDDVPDKVAQLPMCEHDRFYAAENLNHDVFNLFF